jgi:hypothetical protein
MGVRTFLTALSKQQAEQRQRGDDEGPLGDVVAHCFVAEKIVGYWFCARVQLETPLAVLEQHGTFHPGPPLQLPEYGSAKEGMWLPLSQATKLQLPPYVDSDIGPIPSDGGDYLRFVKAFRRIIEAKTSVDVTIAQLNALLQHNATYQVFAKKHAPDFVMMWFMNELLVVPGLDPKSARQLFTAGYRTIEELRAAPDSVLQGILQEEATVKKIRRFMEERSRLQEGGAGG